MSVDQITPEQLKQRLADDPQPLIVDVRTPAEYREVHVVGAVNVPLDQLTPDRIFSHAHGSSPPAVHFICKKGGRGRQACEKVIPAGLTAINVDGGTEACVAAGVPVECGKKSISLERQVRMIAGTMAATGAILAMVVHPYFAAIPAFVGLGLLHAGVTDSCMMGLALAKMPWNQ